MNNDKDMTKAGMRWLSSETCIKLIRMSTQFGHSLDGVANAIYPKAVNWNKFFFFFLQFKRVFHLRDQFHLPEISWHAIDVVLFPCDLSQMYRNHHCHR